jgi:hypothetical protein
MFNATERSTPVAPALLPACLASADRALPSAFPPQVVSFGPLGVLGRNGWFCREGDVDRWNALAGYRGLRDPQVWRHFNGTFLAFERSWGDEELRMMNLDLRYDVAYLGAIAAADAIRARLDAGLPAFFYLWSPHALNSRYRLNRIQLPAYTPKLFNLGRSDYPTDVLEKVAATEAGRIRTTLARAIQLAHGDVRTEQIKDWDKVIAKRPSRCDRHSSSTESANIVMRPNDEERKHNRS